MAGVCQRLVRRHFRLFLRNATAHGSFVNLFVMVSRFSFRSLIVPFTVITTFSSLILFCLLCSFFVISNAPFQLFWLSFLTFYISVFQTWINFQTLIFPEK